MQPPKSIIIKKQNVANKTADIPDLPKQQLYEQPILTTEIITQEVIKDQTFFPRGIHLEDLDAAFIKWVQDFNFQLEGNLVPVYLYSLQRFSEFMQSWDIMDKTQHPTLPLITVTKESPAKKGTMLGTVSNVLPSNDTYPLYKIPKVINGKTLFEYVEVPQPTYIDLQYKINVFMNHQRDVNKFNELILQEFKKPQNAIDVYGHNMELFLDDIADNNKTELEERRYYRHIFVVNLKAFLLDEKDFKVKRSLNRINLNVGGNNTVNSQICNISVITALNQCDTCILFNFNKKSPIEGEYILPFNFNVTYDNQSTSDENVEYYVNNSPSTLPFSLNKNDVLKVVYTKEITKPVQVKVCGKKIV